MIASHDSTPGLVSVVIPTFNRAVFLPDAIDSVLRQTYDDFELFVVDDGSTDDTIAVVEPYKQRLTYIPREGPRGPSAARNEGIRAAKGEFLAFLDSDDLWLPDKLEQQLALLRADPMLGMVGGGCVYVDEMGEPLGPVDEGPSVISYEDFAIATSLPGSASNAVIRRSVLAEVGLFDEALYRGEDKDLWLRISRRFRVKCVRRPTVQIRVHTGSGMRSRWRDVVRDRRRVDGRIPNWRYRRKAAAWMWYNLFNRDLAVRGATILGPYFLLRSFLSYPFGLGPSNRRLRPCLVRLLPERWVEFVRKMRR